jgi:hypothetical protein
MTIVEAQTPALSDPRADLTMLAGTWRNTNSESDGIVKIVATAEGGALCLELNDSERIPAAVYYERNDEGCEQPFTAEHDYGFMEVVLYGFLRQGVLVLLTFNRFKDGSARSNYFAKEFFYRTVFYAT